MQQALVVVTGNQGKAREFGELLGIETIAVKVPVPELQALHVVDVVEAKAQAAYEQLGRPLVVDDTEISFRSWHGLPGALTSWFMETVGNDGLLSMLSAFDDRAASVTTALGYHDGSSVQVYCGTVQGSIATTIRGDKGFGYDSIFVPDGFEKTFAEMDEAEKNACSMRRAATDKLRAAL